MNTEYTRKVVEAALLAAGRSLSLIELAQIFELNDKPDNDQLRAVLEELGASYADRAVELKETAQGFRIQVRREFADPVSRLWPERPPRYSRALLETLAIIAYRQPLTRAEIEGIRGVAVNPNIIKTLSERNWIRVVGHREVPGRPEILATTRDFLDYFGLKALDQLPPLSELKSLDELDPQLALPVPITAQVGTDTVEEGAPAALPAPEASADAPADNAETVSEAAADTDVQAADTAVEPEAKAVAADAVSAGTAVEAEPLPSDEAPAESADAATENTPQA